MSTLGKDARVRPRDPNPEETERVEALLVRLNDDEKVSLLSGSGMWQTGGLRKKGVPTLRMTDGPQGARGCSPLGKPGAALVPCESALAATFNEELIEKIGSLLGHECAQHGAHVLLGPNANLQRMPTSGRHFECFSEDPYLSARATVAYIRGVQRHVAACVKHFVCNDQESDRHRTNSVVDERTLREVYLQPFQAAVTEAGVAAVMCGYNRLNGTYCTRNSWLLEDILRREWHFDGFVLSDWWGSSSTVSALESGLNVEMPLAEPKCYGGYLLDAVRSGAVSRQLLDERCRPVLRAALRFDRGPQERWRHWPCSRRQPRGPGPTRDLLRRAAAESLVLLRNEGGVLPLKPERLHRVAVLGPNAGETTLQGGGSSRIHPHHCKTILEALREALEPKGVEVLHERGVLTEDMPGFAPNSMLGLMGGCDRSGQPSLLSACVCWAYGVCFERVAWLTSRESFRKYVAAPYYRRLLMRGVTRDPQEAAASLQRVPQPLLSDALLVPPLICTLLLPPLAGALLLSRAVLLSAATLVPLVLVVAATALRQLQATPTCSEADAEAMLAAAERAAAAADLCVLVLGTHGGWEIEGTDQPHMMLPGRQDELVARVVKAARGPVVVVLNVGSPKRVLWLQRVAAVLLAHFGGEEMADAVADALLGHCCPAGRLPCTWPVEGLQSPGVLARIHARDQFSRGNIIYLEGCHVGYRGFNVGGLAAEFKPAFPFGHGLSYTLFGYSELKVRLVQSCKEDGGPRARVEVVVTNEGGCTGAEVAQLYTKTPETPKALRGFRRTALLDPREKELIVLELGSHALGAFFDAEAKAWRAPEIGSTVFIDVGGSSADVQRTALLVIT